MCWAEAWWLSSERVLYVEWVVLFVVCVQCSYCSTVHPVATQPKKQKKDIKSLIQVSILGLWGYEPHTLPAELTSVMIYHFCQIFSIQTVEITLSPKIQIDKTRDICIHLYFLSSFPRQKSFDSPTAQPRSDLTRALPPFSTFTLTHSHININCQVIISYHVGCVVSKETAWL